MGLKFYSRRSKIKEIFDHISNLKVALDSLNVADIERFIDRLTGLFEGDHCLFIGGNGGSQSISEHISTDWTKGVFTETGRALRISSLNSVNSLNTAIANDLGYEESLSFNFELFARERDGILLISSSGKSPNIIRAAELAKRKGNIVLALSGFGASDLYQVADCAITIDSNDYQVIEDVHAILGHAIFKQLIENLLD